MASLSQQQQRIKRNSGFSPPTRSQSMYIQRSGLDEPEILKRRVCSTRGRRARKSTIFSSRSVPKIPQVENSIDLFEKVTTALSDCAQNLKDNIQSSSITAKKNLEQKLRWCEDRLSQIVGLYEFYQHEIKMRQGARNLETALLSYGVKHGHDKCKSNYKESTQNMCEIEDEFERRMGRFKVKLDSLDGFARLCPGDNFEIFLRNGVGRKWKAKCKIERDGQKWIDNNIEVKGSVKDGLFLRIIEVKKIQANAQLGSFSVRLRNYIAARPMNLSIPVNKTGNLKLRVTIHWQPLSIKEEVKIRKTNRDGLLSDVFFGSAVTISHEESPRISIQSPPGFSPSSPSPLSLPSTASDPSLSSDSISYQNHRDENESSTSMETQNQDVPLEYLSEEVTDFTSRDEEVAMETPPLAQASTLDELLRTLQRALTEHKDQHPQLQQLYEKLEKLDEILQGGKLMKCNLSGSVESALESFSFLDITEVGVKPDNELRPFDTGYSSSTDETQRTVVDHRQMNGETFDATELRPAEARAEENEAASINSSRDNDADNQSTSSYLGSTGITIVDKVLLQHLKFCLRLTTDLGSIGPLKCKETSAVLKLEWQCGILEKLIELASVKQPPQTISKAYSPLAASGHDEILLFWAGNCGENPLFIPCDGFLEALKKHFHSQVEEGYSRVAEKLYPVITTRILEENGSLLAANIEEDSLVSIYQFTDFFLLDHRWNLVKFVTDVADELLTCGRLMNPDKHVVLTQLQMYNKIPFKQSCCVTAARLLADTQSRVVDAAGVYFETLLKDTRRRAQAVSYCVDALEDGDEDLRVGACAALQRLQGKEASEQLLFLAKCDTERVRQAAESAIASFGTHSKLKNDGKNARIWTQTTVMSDISKSTDF